VEEKLELHSLKNEELLKEKIFQKYLELQEGSDRGKHTLQLRDFILSWSNKYFYKNSTYIYWEEIGKAVFRIVKQDKTKFPDIEEFFRYIKVSLCNAKAEYYREKEKKLIHIPKEQLSKIKEIFRYIEFLECEKRRQLSEFEKIKYAAEWFNTTEEKMRNYLDKIAEMKGINIYNDDVLEGVYIDENNPEASLINAQLGKEEGKKIYEALRTVFAMKPKKTLPLKRALFTAQCLGTKVDNDWLIDNFSWIYEFLDKETLESYKKNGKPPTNKEIILRFKPGVKNPDQVVSPIFTTFMINLETALKDKNVNFSF
jgi:hypothetical protein